MLALLGTDLSVVYFVFDEVFGNVDALQMVRQTCLHLVSKLRQDTTLYFPYEGSYPERVRWGKHGHKLDYRRVPKQCLKTCSGDKDVQTTIYQMHLWHKLCADLLNIAVIVKTNMQTGASLDSHKGLFA